ncbi:MAG: LSM domain-containing protein [Candidatus Ranarchaeia archaeon]
MSGQKPLTLLERSVDSIVLVKLRGNRRIRGKLYGFDAHMNLILTDSDEYIENDNDETENQPSAPIPRGTIIVRGDNVIIIAPSPR